MHVGWEFAALVPLFEAYGGTGLPLPFGQLQLEIHANEMPFDKMLEWCVPPPLSSPHLLNATTGGNYSKPPV